jgi:hypothetical protein
MLFWLGTRVKAACLFFTHQMFKKSSEFFCQFFRHI